MNYRPIIGLEIHVELSTKTKMFCRCSADWFGKVPNTQTCPVCLGLPGALPYPNKKAIEDCIKIALSLNSRIANYSFFERKNYFYPDLPKGYQISQYQKPFGYDGYIGIETKTGIKKVRIRRVHMEEDTAKLIHQSGDQKYSLIDFNRSGVPLVEIVTEPDIESGQEAKLFLTKLQRIIRYLGVSNADMEKGQMRLEPNISLRELKTQNSKLRTEELPSYKVEVKNINSFRFVDKAINFEIERQTKLLSNDKRPKQETRGWSESKGETVSQRSKEEAHDYRYFPEPDIPPLTFDDQKIIDFIKEIPELPDQKKERFLKDYGLNEYDTSILIDQKDKADFFEETVMINKKLKEKNEKYTEAKSIANWLIHKKMNIAELLPAELVKMIMRSTQTAIIDENELEQLIEKVLLDNKAALSDYKKGKHNALMFLVGQVMRESNAKLDAQKVKDKLIQAINKNGGKSGT